MGLEALVFDGDDGLAQNRRKVVVVDDDAALQGKGADDAAFAVVEIGGGGGAVALKVVDLGQIDGVDEREAGQRARDDGEQREERRKRPCRQVCRRRTVGTGSGSGRADE